MLDAVRDADPKARMPWYGPDMSVTSKLTARFMETWSQGWDMVDALGQDYEPTDRLRHVVFLGLQALPNAFTTHRRPVPTEPVRVDIAFPSGARLALGPADAENTVVGSGFELALLVTNDALRPTRRCRRPAPSPVKWLEVAQAFAGPPGAKHPRQPAV